MPGKECCPLSIIHKDPCYLGEHLHQSGRYRTPAGALGGEVERGSECKSVLFIGFEISEQEEQHHFENRSETLDLYPHWHFS